MRLGLRSKNKVDVCLTEMEKPDLWGYGVERQPLNSRTGRLVVFKDAEDRDGGCS